VIIEDVIDGTIAPLEKAVSVVIPAYNEAPHVAEQIEAVAAVLRRTGWRWEIIVVDDGSKDGTAEAAATTGVRVLRRVKNQGYGAALLLGIRAAAHDWVMIIDADGTYPVEAIPELLELAPRNEMVVGARTGLEVAIPWERRPAKWFLRKLASYLAEREIPDINSGLRLMRRALVLRYAHLLPRGFSFTTTITLASTCNGHAVEYVPINYAARLGKSSIKPRHLFDFTLLTLRVIVYFNPLRVFLPLGAALAMSGFVKFVWDMFHKQKISGSVVVAFLGTLMIWSLGMLADQNSRIAMFLGSDTSRLPSNGPARGIAAPDGASVRGSRLHGAERDAESSVA
jgi:glycosyltransferase involved in cell wall biosynthesis